MTTTEIQKQIKKIKALTQEVKTSPEKARQLLVKTGMYKKDGSLKPEFK